jgi:diamine N-acetyltransferase
MLKNKNIQLRAPELSDLELIYKWENDTELWYLSQTQIPFSRFDIEQFILQGNHDIYVEKQFRFMIDSLENQETVGCVDLFDFDPSNKRAGVGILMDANHREKGFASEALDLLIAYARHTLHLHQLYCNILLSNKSSMLLFKRKHFQETGVKKDWIFINDKFHDEVVLQLIL